MKHTNENKESKGWRDSYEYTRLMEILDGYWLDQPNELMVKIHMEFFKNNGETQVKDIVWRNPKELGD